MTELLTYEQDIDERYRKIKEEEGRGSKHALFLENIRKRIAYYREHPEKHPLLREMEQNDYDYQMDVDTSLSLSKPTGFDEDGFDFTRPIN